MEHGRLYGRVRAYVLTRLKLDLTSYPKLDAWLDASINRPAAKVARKLRE